MVASPHSVGRCGLIEANQSMCFLLSLVAVSDDEGTVRRIPDATT